MSKGKYIKDGRPVALQSGWQPLRNPYVGAKKQKGDSSTIGAESVSAALRLLGGKVELHVTTTESRVVVTSPTGRVVSKAERKSAERAARAAEVRARDRASMAKAQIAGMLKGLL